MAYPDDLMKDAYHLAGRGGKNPKQSSLRRAASTAYYAVFHMLIADFVSNWRIPEQRARLGRIFEHRRMAQAPLEYRDKKKPTQAEKELKALIDKFKQLQNDRYEADYNVGKIWTPIEVKRTLDLADELFGMWRKLRKEKVAEYHLMSMFGARH